MLLRLHKQGREAATVTGNKSIGTAASHGEGRPRCAGTVQQPEDRRHVPRGAVVSLLCEEWAQSCREWQVACAGAALAPKAQHPTLNLAAIRCVDAAVGKPGDRGRRRAMFGRAANRSMVLG